MDRILRIQEAQQADGGVDNPVAARLNSLETRLWRELRAYIGLTGLSPADRSRMRVDTPEKPASAPDRFLQKLQRSCGPALSFLNG